MHSSFLNPPPQHQNFWQYVSVGAICIFHEIIPSSPLNFSKEKKEEYKSKNKKCSSRRLILDHAL